MSWQFEKLTAVQASFWGYEAPEGASHLCRLVRVMPDGQKFGSIFWVSLDRRSSAVAIKIAKQAARNQSDAEWMPNTTTPQPEGQGAEANDET